MAVLSRELIGGREGVEIVAVASDILDDAATETMWQSTTVHGTKTVTLNKAVANNQKDREVVDARLAAAAYDARNPADPPPGGTENGGGGTE